MFTNPSYNLFNQPSRSDTDSVSTNTDGYNPETDSSKDTFPGYLPKDIYFEDGSDLESNPEWDDCNSNDEYCFHNWGKSYIWITFMVRTLRSLGVN